jgi:hypothetical protein
MAIVAKLCFICLQQTFVRRGMGNMTADAFPLLQQRVDKTTFESFLKGFMTFQTYLPLGAELELELILSVSRCGKGKKAREAEREKSTVS